MPSVKSVNYATAPKLLFEFEQQCGAAIAKYSILGWNIWHICKVVVFYHLIRDRSGQGVPVSTGTAKRRGVAFKALGRFLGQALRSVVKTRGVETLFITNSADKLSKTADGVYYNSLIYPYVQLAAQRGRYQLYEAPGRAGLLEPASYKTDVDLTGYSYLLALVSRLYKKESFKEAAAELCASFNAFMQERGYNDDPLETSFIEGVIAVFLAERKIYSIIYALLKPKAIVSSEKMGRGLLAAAIDRKIPFAELQHGSIDAYYPPYVWNAPTTGGKVLKPTQLGVFGAFAKNLIIRTGFFATHEVAVVGYGKMDAVRREVGNSGNRMQSQVLVVLQPMMHDLNLEFMQALRAIAIDGVVIRIKAHPLQAEAEIAAYKAVLAGSATVWLDKNENIYNAIGKSDLVVGYITTCLEEAISLGVPAYTISTPELPAGLHSMTQSDKLTEAIRPVALDALQGAIEVFYSDETARMLWLDVIRQQAHSVYAAVPSDVRIALLRGKASA